MASRLGISVSSYCEYRAGKNTQRVINKLVLSEKIKYCFADCKELYGSSRLSVELTKRGTRVSRTTTAKYMKELGLRSKFYRKFRNTTDSKHCNQVAENLLDRGVQYTCKDFVKLLDKYGCVRSNSRKGNCWDNAVAESFFKTLKCELVYQFKNLLAEKMRTEVFGYIECWCNKKPRH